MRYYVRNRLKHNIAWFYCKITVTFYSIKIACYKQIVFFAFQKWKAIKIVFQIWYQCAKMSENALNSTLHRLNCNRLLRHYIPLLLLMINIITQIILCSIERNCNNNTYQCAIVLEITLNLTLPVIDFNDILFHKDCLW